VFTEWFHESFEPSVKTFLKKQNLPAKALLILDNDPGHQISRLFPVIRRFR
jgi:hypothetical protein